MPVSAQNRSRLLSTLRSGFVNQPNTTLAQFISLGLTPVVSPSPSSMVAAVSSATSEPLVTASSTTDNFFSTQEQLDILEQVMDQVTADKATTIAAVGSPLVATQPPPAPLPRQPQPEPQLEQQQSEVYPVPAIVTAPPDAASPPLSTQWAPMIPQALDQSAQAAAQQYQPLTSTSATKELQPVAVMESPTVVAESAPLVVESMATTSAAAENANLTSAVEAAVAAPYQEVGPVSPEISPEIESYLQEVAAHSEQLPQEIVVTATDIQVKPQAQSLRPVIVLPITPEIEAVGAKKKLNWSVRWLVEWSRRLMKMFSGKVIYHDSDTV